MKKHEFKGIVEDYSFNGNQISIVIKSKYKIKGNYYFKDEIELNAFKDKIKYGVELNLKGLLSIPSNNTIPNTFNYKKHLLSKNIYYLLKIENINITDKKISFIYEIKNALRARISKYYNSDYLLTFIIGDKTMLNPDIFDSYRVNGVTHLFAISGMHINLFSAILIFILKKLKFDEKSRFITIIIFLSLYSFLTNFSASIIRAVVFYVIITINKILYLNISNIRSFIIAVFILLIINPFLIYDLGFQYSALTCFGLIIGSKILNNKNYVIGTLLVSSVAFLFSLPITLQNFFEINILSIFNNLIFVPIITFIVYPFSLIILIIRPFENLFNLLIIFIEFLTNLLSNFSLNINIPKNSLFLILIYYIMIILFISRKNYIYIFVALFLIIIPKIYYSNISTLDMYFLDVGQGDAILIRTPYNKENIMIDVGGKLEYKQEDWAKKEKKYHISDNLITFYKSLGITNIDIVTTHGDDDHMGETINLVNNYKVEKVIFNCGEFNDLENELIKVLDKKRIPYYSCIKELNIDNNKLYFLQTKEYDNENDNSNVIYTEIDGYKFMFMGDASVEVEEDLIKKYNLNDIDILKVGHHGSKTSSGKNFINETNPKYSIISVGKNNRYGHPNDGVLDNLEDSKIYRTDQDGSVMFKIQKNKLEIETCVP